MKTKDKMTPEEALDAMKKLAKDDYDPEANLGTAIAILCALLRHLGHADVVKTFGKVKVYF